MNADPISRALVKPSAVIGTEFTSVDELDGQYFAIINKADGMALYGSNAQNLAYDVYSNAFSSSNSGYLWKLVSLADDTDEDVQAYYRLQLITPTGADYNCWGVGGWLNSQPADRACSFILGLNNQNGQDMKNGAVYDVQYEEGLGFTLKNIGTGLYQGANAGPASNEEPTYFSFATVSSSYVPALEALLEEGEQYKAMITDDAALAQYGEAIAGIDPASVEIDGYYECQVVDAAITNLVKALPADAGQDFTRAIVNPSFENGNIDDWSNLTERGGRIANNGNFSAATGSYFVEKWTSAPGTLSDGYLVQEISGLPAGMYMITAEMQNLEQGNDNANGTGYFLVANNDRTEVASAGEIVVVTTILSAGEDLTIGAVLENCTGNWVCVDNFTLTLIDPDAVVDDPVHIANTAETAYTIPEAIELIDAGEALDETVFVKGTVSLIDYLTDDGSLIYWISEDGTNSSRQFMCYLGKSFDGADFAAADDVEVGAEVIVKGTLALYGGTYEFNPGNQLVSYKEPVRPLFADGTYYIYNVGANKYLGAGASWGTHAIVDNTGLDYYITFNMGKYTLDSRVSNGGDSQYLNGEWNDGPAFGWTIEDKGNGYYMISDGDLFLAAQEDGLVVMTDDPTSSCLWTLVTQEQRLAELANATPENPIDATFLIQGANFSRTDQRNYAWSMDASSQNLSGGNNVNNCAESWHSTFTLTQTLYNAPVGKYLVSAQGFYRQDGEIEEVPVFYANTSTAEFPVNTGTENSMSDASESFSAGLYNIEPFVVNVSEAGALTIGARGTALSQWVIFDNFRLTYLSSEVAIDDIAANYAQVLADAVAALESEHYAMVTGIERTSLEETIEAYSSVANDQDAYTVAINNLSYATNYFTNAKDAYESLIKAKELLAISVDNYPYAEPWYKEEVVKYAELTAQMADEAYDLASAITSYARRIAESHALLEGVERSSDMTEYIMNPNANDDRNYWELVYDGGGYIVIRSNEPLTDADYRIYPYFDGGYWESDYWNVALQQEIYLPAGRYQLTVSSRASSDVAFTLYAGDESVAMPTIGAEGGLYGNGWNDTSLEFEVPEEGPVTIGVRGESNVIYNWMSFTRFRLARFPNAADYNNLYIADNTNLSRGNAILPISLQNEDEIVGLQFDVILPYDMNLTEIESGFRSGSHGVSFNQMNNNTFRVVMASMDNEVIEGYDGVLMNLGLEIPAYLSAGWYDVILRNVVMTTSSLQTIKCADQSFGVKITGRMGDVNNDDAVDVTDAVLIIDDILLKNPANYDPSLADVNGDGDIDVTDVVFVIDAILGKIELSRGAELIDRSAYTAFQMDLTIPVGYVLESVSLTDIAKDSHSLAYNMLPDGRCRVVVCSMNNEALPGAWDEVIRLNLRGQGDAQVNIDRAVFVTIDGERHELMMNPTSIAELSTFNSPLGPTGRFLQKELSTRYDLQGRKVEKNAKGILIENGKKVVKK